MSRKMLKVDFLRVKAAQNKNLTTKEIRAMYGYGTTTINCMKRCKTFEEYRRRFCKRSSIENVRCMNKAKTGAKKIVKAEPQKSKRHNSNASSVKVIVIDDLKERSNGDIIAAIITVIVCIAILALIVVMVAGSAR